MTHHHLPAGCTKIPWGFIEKNGLVANSTVAQRNARYELGEFAIGLLGKLGVSEEMLDRLSKEADPLAALLQKIQQGTPTETTT
jgi:hypothetical protein